ncbi:unnamed protein product [Cuscuta epithymum]|uniref:C2 NT-type domain-containing protein n=1 Tax=Cuscuta epithymum TaxID=186058 RepID=A0AAV0C4S0_9ASTE|nr:unnamed protein product [Cuscuta epithymum]
MVVKMMKWRPWPPLISKKIDVRLVIRRLENLGVGEPWSGEVATLSGGASVEIGWKGPPKAALRSFRRTVKRNCTKEAGVKNGQDGAFLVEWDDEFQNVCNLSGLRDNAFHPWEISFTVFFNESNQGSKNKLHTVGTAVLNLAEFAAKTEEGKEFNLKIPLAISGNASEARPILCISLSVLELITPQEPTELVEKPITSPPQPPGETPSSSSVEKDELSALKAGLRKVKILTDYVSVRRAKKPCREEDISDCRSDHAYPSIDSESLDGFEEGEESDERKGQEDSPVRNSFSYGTLPYANYAVSSTRIDGEDEGWIYYSNSRSDVGWSANVDCWISQASEPVVLQQRGISILPWRKRKERFRSPKGEPLLRKECWEEGGDDIDYDRRQLSSDESVSFGWHRTEEEEIGGPRPSISGFCDDNFAVGTWEQKQVMSRDGHAMLQTQIFFASIDQRSEQASGESACTSLVTVIADWLHTNRDLMPVKSQFDSLIREGSSEWRTLCQDEETYLESFPDKHFDLDTVLRAAKTRCFSVIPEKSFVGFFNPDMMDDKGSFDFLQGALSFDNIWDEISCDNKTVETQVYIVSWNDHFFVLKAEPEAYYIIDTLGERLWEGCNQAYILKFDKNSVIYKVPSVKLDGVFGQEEPRMEIDPKEIICEGKETCKHYIKDFLAAIPIRELQEDINRGLMISVPLHHRLQIEFHYTAHSQQPSAFAAVMEVAATATAAVVEAATTTAPAGVETATPAAASQLVEVALNEVVT